VNEPDRDDLKPRIALIGAGRVGSVLARTWATAGITISAVASRTANHARALADELGTLAETAVEAAALADLTVLAVPDDAITTAAASLNELDWRGKGVIHLSGAHTANLLEPLAQRGAMTGSLHPAYPFARSDIQPNALRGVTFAIESNHPRLTEWLYDLVNTAEGRALPLRQDQKRLYHAALTLTSNYAVTLYAASKRLLRGIGAGDETADAALLALLGGTLDNLREQSVPNALTGPLVRDDVGTVEAHLEALSGQRDIASAYLTLARLTLPLLQERGIDIRSIEGFIEKWEGTWFA
jgi:predicted short-subunit dehydrogenase-like oxidoreductase (DUF2520 family)